MVVFVWIDVVVAFVYALSLIHILQYFRKLYRFRPGIGKWTEDRAPADSGGAGDPVCEDFIGKLEKKIRTIRRIQPFDTFTVKMMQK